MDDCVAGADGGEQCVTTSGWAPCAGSHKSGPLQTHLTAMPHACCCTCQQCCGPGLPRFRQYAMEGSIITTGSFPALTSYHMGNVAMRSVADKATLK